jgi:hypothetical protein
VAINCKKLNNFIWYSPPYLGKYSQFRQMFDSIVTKYSYLLTVKYEKRLMSKYVTSFTLEWTLICMQRHLPTYNISLSLLKKWFHVRCSVQFSRLSVYFIPYRRLLLTFLHSRAPRRRRRSWFTDKRRAHRGPTVIVVSSAWHHMC